MAENDDFDLNSLDDEELVEQTHDDLYNGLKDEVEEATRLFLARGWQAGLYNPGGFGAEFRALRLGRRFALATALIGAVAALPIRGAVVTIAADALLALLLVYLLQGLALVHALVHTRVVRPPARRGWLGAVYVVLLFAAPNIVPLLAMMGWVDAWVDMRKRWSVRG